MDGVVPLEDGGSGTDGAVDMAADSSEGIAVGTERAVEGLEGGEALIQASQPIERLRLLREVGKVLVVVRQRKKRKRKRTGGVFRMEQKERNGFFSF